MRHFLKLWVSLLVGAAVLLPAGCASRQDISGDGAYEPTAMGRYVEAEYPFPEPVYLVTGFDRRQDGAIEFFGAFGTMESKISPKLIRSQDGGKSWEAVTVPWLQEAEESDNAYSMNRAAWDAQDRLVISYNMYDPAADVDGEYLVRIAWDPETKTYGAAETLPFELPSSSGGAGVNSLLFLDSGDLIAVCYDEIFQLDAVSGEVKASYSREWSQTSGDVAVLGTYLAYSDAGRILVYDTAGGGSQLVQNILCGSPAAGEEASSGTKDTASVSSDGDSNRVLAAGPDGAFYFADGSGLYRFFPDSPTLEKIVDGALTSLSMPSYDRLGLSVGADGKGFSLLCYQEDTCVLLSYTYDPNVSTVPAKELKVYSLEDNLTVRQAIGSYQRQNPDMHILYEVGTDDGVSASDTLRILSMELLAGRGPDLLVLDGLPVESYLQKGVLKDLSSGGPLAERLEKGDFLENILQPFQQNGALYAVPARFSVPMMLGRPDLVSQAGSLSGLADWLEQHPDQYDIPLSGKDSRAMLRQFYPVCARSLQDENGAFSREGLSDFLRSLRRIQDLDRRTEADRWEYQIHFEPLIWEKGTVLALAMGNLSSSSQIYAPLQASGGSLEGTFTTLLQQDVFLPATILGIPASSKQIEQAEMFLDFTLSDSILKYDFSDGLPVTKSAFAQAFTIPDDKAGQKFSYYGASYLDSMNQEQYSNMSVMYPFQTEADPVAALLRSLNTPVLVDSKVLTILEEGAVPYLTGSAELDRTVDGLLNKLHMTLQEQS